MCNTLWLVTGGVILSMSSTSPAVRVSGATEPEIMKTLAVSAVIWQLMLNVMLLHYHSTAQKIEIGILYDLVKFSAPMFIFAIAFDLAKLRDTHYSHYVWHKTKEIIGPYLAWTAVYMIAFNAGHYSTIWSVVKGILLGGAAPQLWYTIMMFQIHLLLPLLTGLVFFLLKNKKNTIGVIIITIIIYAGLIAWYSIYAFHNQEHPGWVQWDRLLFMFGIYAVLGVIASTYNQQWRALVERIRWWALPVGALLFILVNHELFSFGLDTLNLLDASYLKWSMVLFNITLIIIVYGFTVSLINTGSKSLQHFKFIAKYAFRAYLASYFALQLTVALIGDYFSEIPLGLNLLITFGITAFFSFAIVYIVEWICKKIMALFRKSSLPTSQQTTTQDNVVGSEALAKNSIVNSRNTSAARDK